MSGKALKQSGEIASSELPFEGVSRGLVVILEPEQRGLEFVQRRKVAGCKHLALYDREVDFDLVEPTGMDGRVDEGDGWPLRTDPGDGALSAMGGSIVDDPEDGAVRSDTVPAA